MIRRKGWNLFRWKSLESLALAGLICAAGAWTQTQAQEAAVVELSPGRIEAATAEPGKYAIGVHCRPVDPALRKHLKLGGGEGVVVEHVVPESPAAAAKLEQYDVLVAAAGEPLQSIADLMRIVSDSEGKELKVELLRAGKKMLVSVTPVERAAVKLGSFPLGDGTRWADQIPQGGEFDEIRKWVERFQADPQQAIRLRGVGPGIVLDGREGAKLPGGVSISISKSGEEPAKIHVTRKSADGEESWDVTEESIDELPEDLRPHVRRMVGMPGGVRFDLRRMQPRIETPRAGDIDRRVERRLEEVEQRMERMMEELRSRRGDSEESQPKSRRPRREKTEDEKTEAAKTDV